MLPANEATVWDKDERTNQRDLHAIARAAERYGLVITTDTLQALEDKVRRGQVGVIEEEPRFIEAEAMIGTVLVRFVYARCVRNGRLSGERTGQVVTFLQPRNYSSFSPNPPSLPEKKFHRGKRRTANTLARRENR